MTVFGGTEDPILHITLKSKYQGRLVWDSIENVETLYEDPTLSSWVEPEPLCQSPHMRLGSL